MSNIFVISDTHFNHARILEFTNRAGNKIRPGFASVDEMNQKMIEDWNSVVGKRDTVRHLGDVYFGSDSEANEILWQLNGSIQLFLGNHDHINDVLIKRCSKIELWRKDRKNDIIFSHMPLHASVLDELSPTAWNLHGHIHDNDEPPAEKSHAWVNMSVERFGYKPIPLDEIIQRKKEITNEK